MKFLTYEEIGKKVAERALDDFLVNDKTLREWINLMSEGMIPISVIEDIKAEIVKTVEEETQIDKKWSSGLKYALQIIDKHIGG